MPKAYEELRAVHDRLETHYNDMQDFEFTIEESKLFMLQTRNGKRTGFAAVRIAIDMVDEGLITAEEALAARRAGAARPAARTRSSTRRRRRPRSRRAGSRPRACPPPPAPPAAASASRADDAVAWPPKGKPVILVRDGDRRPTTSTA